MADTPPIIARWKDDPSVWCPDGGLTRRCYVVGATAAHQGGSFWLIVASFYRIASPLPLPFLHETTIKRCIGDGNRNDDSGQFEVGVDDAVLVGRSDGGESGW